MFSTPHIEEGAIGPAPPHRPVLLREVLEQLRPGPGGIYVDCTVGVGGHAEAVLEATGPDGRLVGIDRDLLALEFATRRLARFGERFSPVHGNHREMASILQSRGLFTVDGVIADLGVSSLQLDDADRGFSFRLDGPLDMRMDPTQGPTAAELLGSLPEAEIRRILRVFGEERLAGPIAREIVRARERGGLNRTRELADLVAGVAGPRGRAYAIHPATRTFQALRIAVNGEVEGLESWVTEATSMLKRGGRLVVVAFHSLEDRAVKRGIRSLAERCICPPRLPVCGCGRENFLRILTLRPLTPSREELATNPRSRSAKLRAAERI